MAEDYVIRPMVEDDVHAVEELTAEGFVDLERRIPLPNRREPVLRTRTAAVGWRHRMRHALRHDPRGAWVAEDGAGLLGVAVALRRDLTWVLATYVVRPGFQGRGIGRHLLDAALAYGDGCLRAMVSASSDPAAARRYRAAGFTLHPMMYLSGRVPRGSLPVVERVREGGVGDLDLMDSVDRQIRDAAHGVDHELLIRSFRAVLVDRTTGSGYAYVDPGGGPYLLAATNRRTATDLLWECLAASSPGEDCTISHLTAPNEWALDVGLSARMALHSSGYLALRHMRPPMPYLPSGHFL